MSQLLIYTTVSLLMTINAYTLWSMVFCSAYMLSDFLMDLLINLQIISKLYRIHTNSNKTAIESYINILMFFKTMAIFFFSSSIFILRIDFQSKTLASESY